MTGPRKGRFPSALDLYGPDGPPAGGPRWSRHVGRFGARVVWDTRVTGAHHVPAAGPVILAANHTGVVDGPLLLGVAPRPLHILVKDEMFHGFVGSVLHRAGQIPVDRTSGRAALGSALAVLRRGDAVGVFPEGGRGRGDASSGRAGVVWLALAAGAPVVPVAILGTRRTGESTSRLPGPRRRIEVEIGEPLVLERAPGTTGRQALVDANETVRAALAGLVTRASARTGIDLPDDVRHPG
ncbi:1-acyl-sn-glycerol-3-phosphate acyltransferase [Paraoerskovia sediminicola]|uniref:1-acyl-sn-glycerol-3-phosphate acyltransferase n=1 Tax=Paraoerskovia sediminicola TaxID=1138587 RepID=A0ABM8G646_9CELL|nr:lysophospholipid acyltransferase family protein [Paraoerskovia sediminicola]BDZ43591.1 1-acyl-sn-glycerol-3-phosphate acyltransferase [Paraoerskovia sediminicola]